VKFDSENPANELAKMDDTEIDELAFGAIEIDHSGKILRYNAAEGDISGRDPDEVIGKDFFTEVAPCTDRLPGPFPERRRVRPPGRPDQLHLRLSDGPDAGQGVFFEAHFPPVQLRRDLLLS
jgi:PAS domain-containing protein